MAKYITVPRLQEYHTGIQDRLVPKVPGNKGQVLMCDGTKGVWADFDVLDLLSYGVEWKPNVADPVLTRIGNMSYHKSLLIQSGMKGCIYNPKEKKVVYWLREDDWRFSKTPRGVEFFDVEGVVQDSDSVSDYEFKTTELNPEVSYEIFWGHAGSSGEEIIDSCIYGHMIISGQDYEVVIRVISGGGTKDYYLSIISPTTYDKQAFKDAIKDSSIAIQDYTTRFDGYDGEVMVYVPEFYIRSWDEVDRRAVRISPIRIDETWEHQPALFIGAYRDTVLNTVPENMGYLSTLEANTAVSVANNAAYCRGASNNPENDALEDIFRRQLGKCRTAIQRPIFRAYTRKAGKEIMSYRQYKNILYWLWVIEYANFNSQAAFNPELTAEGFHQGGLGSGITSVVEWSAYNELCPIVPNGYTNELGNGTGVKDIVIPSFEYTNEGVTHTQAAQTFKSIRWRGIEDPFGHIWHNVDGIIIDADANNHSNNMNYVYTTDDPAKYGDTAADIANMVLSGFEIYVEGYTKEWDLGTTAEIIPRIMGGNVTQYKCDYHAVGGREAPLKTLSLGGDSFHGASTGLGCFFSNDSVTGSNSRVGFRSVSVA